MREVQQHAHEEVVVFLIGTRGDLEERREISKEEAAVFLKELNGAFFIETSSKTGDNIPLVIAMEFSCSRGHQKYSTRSISQTGLSGIWCGR